MCMAKAPSPPKLEKPPAADQGASSDLRKRIAAGYASAGTKSSGLGVPNFQGGATYSLSAG